MKRTVISALSVLAAVALVCTVSLVFIFSAIDSMEALRTQSLECASCEDRSGAKEALLRLSAQWHTAVPFFETMVDHASIHETSALITDALFSLEHGFPEEYYKSMALLGEAMENICSHETLTWGNLL